MECFAYEGADFQPTVTRQERKKNEDIQEQGISPAEAFAKFAGKTVDYKADAPSRDVPRPTLIAQGSSIAESPQERHLRIKAALAQFRAELQSLPKDGELAQVLLKEIATLEASLEAIVKDSKLAPYFTGPLTQPTQFSQTTAQLLAQLKTETKVPPGPPAAASSKVAPPPPAGASGLTYELYLQQDQKTGGVPDLTAIEKRVHQLEQTVGINEPAAFSDLQSGIVHLRRKLAILESPRELEAIMRKVNNLLSELETLEQQKQQIAGAKSSSHEGAIHSLYKVIPDWDAAGRQLPGIVARLQSIKTLCEQGASARGTLTDLQKEQAQMDSLLLVNQTAYSKLVTELTSSMKSMEAAVNSFEKTFAEVAKTRK